MLSSKRPHIVVASSGLGHIARGVETWASDLSRALHVRGVRVTLCKGAGSAEAPYERVLPCWIRGSTRARWASRLLPRGIAWRLGLESVYGVEQATFAIRLVAYLRQSRAEILHVQDPLVALLAQRARRLGLIRTRVILAHGTEEPGWFLKKFDHVQHLAPAHAGTCRQEGVWQAGWTTIPNFVDTNHFAPGRNDALRAELGIPTEALVVLTVAAIKRSHKRINSLIEEFEKLRKDRPELPVYLVIAGGRENDTDELVRLGNERLGDRVRFLVRFPRERMASLYRSADLFVLASLREMMPIAVLEAGASGLPCIVNNDPVLRWMVGDGGERIDVSAAGHLATAIGKLLADSRRRQTMGAASRAHCVEQFGEDAVVDRVTKYYGSLLDRTVSTASTSAAAHDTTRAGHARVSVVIPAFNCGWCIGEAIESVLAQTRSADEIIVIDDGSSDDTWTRLKPYMSRIRYERRANAGVAAARNRGIELATGDLIAFLDADDVWHPQKLEQQVAVMAREPDIQLLGTRTFPWPESSVPDETSGAVNDIGWRQLAVRNRLATSSVILRRSAIAAVGGFDTELHGPEDYDLWLLVALAGRIAQLQTPLVGYRIVHGSLSQQPGTMEQGLLRIIAKLDRRRAWGGGWLLRRRALANIKCSIAQLHCAAGNGRAALQHLAESFLWFPLPIARSDVRTSWVRLRILGGAIQKLTATRRGTDGGHGVRSQRPPSRDSIERQRRAA